jgi:hypothetical protein
MADTIPIIDSLSLSLSTHLFSLPLSIEIGKLTNLDVSSLFMSMSGSGACAVKTRVRLVR